MQKCFEKMKSSKSIGVEIVVEFSIVKMPRKFVIN